MRAKFDAKQIHGALTPTRQLGSNWIHLADWRVASPRSNKKAAIRLLYFLGIESKITSVRKERSRKIPPTFSGVDSYRRLQKDSISMGIAQRRRRTARRIKVLRCEYIYIRIGSSQTFEQSNSTRGRDLRDWTRHGYHNASHSDCWPSLFFLYVCVCRLVGRSGTSADNKHYN